MGWIDLKDIVANDPPTAREAKQVHDFIRRGAKPRFYADENFPPLGIAILRKLGADAITAEETGRRGQPDENLVAEPLRLGRILITCDHDYLDDCRFPLIHCPAVIVCDFGTTTSSDILHSFDCLSFSTNG